MGPRTSSGSDPRNQTERGITQTDHGSGDGTGSAKRRVLFSKFGSQARQRNRVGTVQGYRGYSKLRIHTALGPYGSLCQGPDWRAISPPRVIVAPRDSVTPNAAGLIPALGALFFRGGPVQDPVLTIAPPWDSAARAMPADSAAGGRIQTRLGPKLPTDHSTPSLQTMIVMI